EQKKKRGYFYKERVFLSPRWEKVRMRAFGGNLHWRIFSCCCGEESQEFRADPEKSFPGSRPCAPALQNSAQSHANRPLRILLAARRDRPAIYFPYAPR